MVRAIWQSIVAEMIHFVLQMSINATQTSAMSTMYVNSSVLIHNKLSLSLTATWFRRICFGLYVSISAYRPTMYTCFSAFIQDNLVDSSSFR